MFDFKRSVHLSIYVLALVFGISSGLVLGKVMYFNLSEYIEGPYVKILLPMLFGLIVYFIVRPVEERILCKILAGKVPKRPKLSIIDEFPPFSFFMLIGILLGYY